MLLQFTNDFLHLVMQLGGFLIWVLMPHLEKDCPGCLIEGIVVYFGFACLLYFVLISCFSFTLRVSILDSILAITSKTKKEPEARNNALRSC